MKFVYLDVTYMTTHIYIQKKFQLNTPVWGSLRLAPIIYYTWYVRHPRDIVRSAQYYITEAA